MSRYRSPQLSDRVRGEPVVGEWQTRILCTRGDWDHGLDVLRPLPFLPNPLDWAINQSIWIMEELRRFEEARDGPLLPKHNLFQLGKKGKHADMSGPGGNIPRGLDFWWR